MLPSAPTPGLRPNRPAPPRLPSLRLPSACLALAAILVAGAVDTVHVIADGRLAIEVEAFQPLPKGWLLERDEAGFTGDGYVRWDGGDQYGGPGSGELVFPILVSEAGRYQVRLRLNTRGAERTDLGNDAWSRFDQGTWVKTLIGGGNVSGWALRTKLEPASHSFADPVYELSAGLHRYALSGRSQGLRIDRILIWRDDLPQPDERLPAALPGPAAPDDLADPAQRAAWNGGRYGAVLAWAARRTDDPAAAEATRRLHAFADERLATIEPLRARDPLAAVELLDQFATAYQGSERGRDLQRLGRDWMKDPRVGAERKARAVAALIDELCAKLAAEKDAKRRAPIIAELRRGRALLRKEHAATAAGAAAERRLAALGAEVIGD